MFQKLLMFLIFLVCPSLGMADTVLANLDLAASDTLTKDDVRYYQVEIPADQKGWRIVLSSDANSNLTVLEENPERTGEPSQGQTIKSSHGDDFHSILLAPEDLTAGTIYYIAVSGRT